MERMEKSLYLHDSQDGKHLVLVDTGADGIDPTQENFFKTCKLKGLHLKTLTLSSFTHGHPDHIGGKH